MYRATAKYLGGHPAALDPARKIVLEVGPGGMSCANPVLSIAAAEITSVRVQTPPPQPANYAASPLAGLFGGLKAQPEGESAAMMRAQEREVIVVVTDDQGREHEMKLTRVTLKGRSRPETKADFAAGDWNGAQRLTHYLLSIRGS